MLILARKENEIVQIGEGEGAVEIKIIQTTKGYVKLGIQAPRSLRITRQELLSQIKKENLHSILIPENAPKIKALSEEIKNKKIQR